EAEESASRVEEFQALTREFMEQLDLDEDVAGALVHEGFSSLEEVAYIPLEELGSIDGFDEEIAQELRTRARDHLLQSALENEERKAELKVDPRLVRLPGLTDAISIALAEKGIGKLEDLADLATDELLEATGPLLTTASAEALILEARKQAGWFDHEGKSGEGSGKENSPKG
ncbi:MAG TPA: transcription termination/antitermination protein NusA, partial [Alphaproteobacteria bacterium]|nr:transcription termination/antitermination protein NusA [Alphaproteobacteria bacterium]